MRIIATGIFLICATAAFFQSRICHACDWVERCEPYREQVEAILESESVSTDFFYLMAAESHCTVKAVSERGASGFWQMLPSTAKHYGCRNLHDLECATRAAARYIKHLQESFKKFDDIIMAWNMGGHNFKRDGATRQARGLVWMVKKGMKCR